MVSICWTKPGRSDRMMLDRDFVSRPGRVSETQLYLHLSFPPLAKSAKDGPTLSYERCPDTRLPVHLLKPGESS
jgi:hypothetical protein